MERTSWQTDGKDLLTNRWKGPPDKQKGPMGWVKGLKRPFIENSKYPPREERTKAHLYGAVVRVQEKLGQWGDLCRAVPAVGAVDEDGASVLHSRDHHVCAIQDGPQVLQPFGGLQTAHPAGNTQRHLHNTQIQEDFNNNYYINGSIYLNLSKSIISAVGLKAVKPAANGALLNVQIINDYPTSTTYIYYTEVHLSCYYMNENYTFFTKSAVLPNKTCRQWDTSSALFKQTSFLSVSHISFEVLGHDYLI